MQKDSSILVGQMRATAVTKRKVQKSTGSTEWYEVRRGIPKVFRKVEQKARTSKKAWKWQRGIVKHPLSESQWNRGHFSMRK